MNHNLWMGGMDLNSAHPNSNMHPRPTLPAGAANPKKKRRTNTKASARSQQTAECPPSGQLQNLRPPPLSCFGDTVSVANPFDDIMPRSSQMHPNVPQYMNGLTRAMNPMGAMGGMRAMMPHNMGAMNQMSNHMNPMGGISPLSNSPVDRMSPMNTMGSHQPPGAMNQMGNHINSMSGMAPMSNSPIGRTSPMNHMGLNQPPGAMNPMRNHMNPMGGMSPMNNSPGERMSPMSHQAPGSVHQMGNHINPMTGMSPMSNSPGELNQRSGVMNSMRNHMNSMGGMSTINSSMGRTSPINNMGTYMNQSHMGLPNNSMTGGAMGNSMGRPGGSPLNGIPGNNQNHMANGGTMNETPPINDPNGPFAQNGSPHHMGMNMHMNSSNLGRQINGPMGNMRSMAPSNINVTGRNSNNIMSMPHQNQMGIPMGSIPNDINGGPPMRHHPMPMGHGFQPRPGMRLITPSTGKVYPPDQPMVFNSQNRNAPPIYLCGTCHKEVNDNDQGIVCESGCNFWFHRMCVGLTEAAFQLLTKEVYAEWVCDKCLKMKKVPPVKFRT